MNSELIAVIDYWVREKGIERQTLIAAVQDCLVGAAKKALGPTRELHCSINPKSGEIKAFARMSGDNVSRDFSAVFYLHFLCEFALVEIAEVVVNRLVEKLVNERFYGVFL